MGWKQQYPLNVETKTYVLPWWINRFIADVSPEANREEFEFPFHDVRIYTVLYLQNNQKPEGKKVHGEARGSWFSER